MAEKETYLYLERADTHDLIKGYAAQDFKIDGEVTSYIKAGTRDLIRVFSYGLSGFVDQEPSGKASGRPHANLTCQIQNDCSITTILSCFFRTLPLNCGILLTDGGKDSAPRGPVKRPAEKNHIFTWLLASGYIVDASVGRAPNVTEDMVSLTFSFRGVFWQDHEDKGKLDDINWDDPTGKTTNFKALWDKGPQ